MQFLSKCALNMMSTPPPPPPQHHHHLFSPLEAVREYSVPATFHATESAWKIHEPTGRIWLCSNEVWSILIWVKPKAKCYLYHPQPGPSQHLWMSEGFNPNLMISLAVEDNINSGRSGKRKSLGRSFFLFRLLEPCPLQHSGGVIKGVFTYVLSVDTTAR